MRGGPAFAATVAASFGSKPPIQPLSGEQTNFSKFLIFSQFQSNSRAQFRRLKVLTTEQCLFPSSLSSRLSLDSTTCPLVYHTIPYCTIPYLTIPYHTLPYHTIPYHTIPYHSPGAIPWEGTCPNHPLDSTTTKPPRPPGSAILVAWSPARLVTWSSGCLVAWSPGRLVVWSPGRLFGRWPVRLFAWLPGRLVTWSPGRLVAWSPRARGVLPPWASRCR